MTRKGNERVYFLDELTVEEEYKIVNEKLETNGESKKIPQRTNGNIFYEPSKLLYIDPKLLPRKLFEEKYSYILTSLLFLPPFANLVKSFVEKDEHDLDCTDTLIQYFNYYVTGIEDYREWYRMDAVTTEDPYSVFKEMLYIIHSELVSKYIFTESEWQNVKNATIKYLYPEYSPIVDLFQFKLRNRREISYITALEENSMNVDLNTSYGFDNECDIKVDKLPHIIAVKLLPYKRINEEIFIINKRYLLKTLMGMEDGMGIAVARRHNGYFEMRQDGVGQYNKLDEMKINFSCAFYVAEDYEFDF